MHILEILERKVGLEKVYTLCKAEMHDRCMRAYSRRLQILFIVITSREITYIPLTKKSNHFFFLADQSKSASPLFLSRLEIADLSQR